MDQTQVERRTCLHNYTLWLARFKMLVVRGHLLKSLLHSCGFLLFLYHPLTTMHITEYLLSPVDRFYLTLNNFLTCITDTNYTFFIILTFLLHKYYRISVKFFFVKWIDNIRWNIYIGNEESFVDIFSSHLQIFVITQLHFSEST